MFNWNSGKTKTVFAIFPDDSPAIDFVLEGDLVAKIYDHWIEKEHGELVDYGGGVRAITVQMVFRAGDDFLTTIKNIGGKRATVIMDQIEDALKEVPYGGHIQ